MWLDIIMEEFWGNLQDKLEGKSESMGRFGCKKWIGQRDGLGYGRMWIRWPDNRRTIERVHRVAFMVRYRWLRDEFPRGYIQGSILEVSHLCHQKLCINTLHMVIETHSINQSRNHCRAQGQCSNDHLPRCIL